MDKAEWLQQVAQKSIAEIGEQRFDVNDWGSCQYSDALAMFNVFRKIRENLSYEDTLDVLGISVYFENKRDIDTIQAMILENFDDGGEEFRIYAAEIPKTKNVDDIFKLFKNCSWDLWEATRFLSSLCFGGLVLTNVPDAPGYGPSGNKSIQSGNYSTGFLCALLVEHGFVDDSNCFGGFDT